MYAAMVGIWCDSQGLTPAQADAIWEEVKGTPPATTPSGFIEELQEARRKVEGQA